MSGNYKMVGGGDIIRKEYLRALGIQDVGADSDKLKTALNRAHEIRQFEIDLYWKRATYFWALQAAAFAAFALLWHDPKDNTRLLAVAFAGIGLVTGCAGWLSARGSKFWQENWEKHIDALEGPFEGHLHKTIWIGPDGVQFSVSRLNERLNLILFLFWVFLFAVSAYLVLDIPCQPSKWIIIVIGLIAITAAAGSLFFTRSRLRGKIFEYGINDWRLWPEGKQKSPSILRRFGPDEQSEEVLRRHEPPL